MANDSRQPQDPLKELNDALARQDARSVYDACNRLGVTPPEEYKDLYERGAADAINEEREEQRLDILVEGEEQANKPWGITESDLSKFKIKELKRIYEGINNLDIPVEMAEVLNAGEMLAKYFCGPYVRRNYRAKEGMDNDDVFFDLVSKMNDAYKQLRGNLKRLDRTFSTKPGDQIERLKALDPSVRVAFLDSFFMPLKYATRRIPDERSYEDQDGGKGYYTKRIHSILKAKWKERTRYLAEKV